MKDIPAIKLDRLREKLSLKMNRRFVTMQLIERPWEDVIELVIEREFFGYRTIEEQDVHFEVKVPQNWWEQLKEQHFPMWFKKRFPVKWKLIQESKTVKFTRNVEYPDVKDQRVIIFDNAPVIMPYRKR